MLQVLAVVYDPSDKKACQAQRWKAEGHFIAYGLSLPTPQPGHMRAGVGGG